MDFLPEEKITIAKATSLGLPLIGGSALKLISKSLGIPMTRLRTKDLDFIASSLPEVATYEDWVKENIDTDKVKTDVMLVRSHDFSKWETMVDGVLTMKPEYLLWSKLTRGSEKDKQDIKWILSIKELSDEAIQSVLDDLGLTQEEADLLEECLAEVSQA
jgi:hypothetical protein